MWKFIKIFMVVLLLSTNLAFSDEIIVDFEEDSVPVLNEELRQLKSSVLWSNNDSGDIVLSATADVDMQQKETKQFVLENRTSDPSDAVTGQIWFRSDL